MRDTEAVNRLVICADACGSGAWGMAARKRMRGAMYRAFDEAFDAVGVQPGERVQEDRGDGILVALDPRVPSSPMVGRWLDTVYESLREYNDGSAPRLRLRVAMHMGPVAHDGRGLVGRAVDLTCRLCDSPAAKRVAAEAADSDLLLVVSHWLYSQVVAEGGRHIEPGHYRSARVRIKETDETAWLHVPRLPAPPGLDPAGRCGERRPPGEAEAPEAAEFPEAAEAAEAAEVAEPSGPQGRAAPVPPSGAARSENRFHVRGDNQVFQHNVIDTGPGGFTGIRKDRPDGDADRGGDGR